MKQLAFLSVLALLLSCKSTPYSGSDIYNDKAEWPKDEGIHYKNSLEWWYYTGHMKERNSDREYGVEYVFFHFTPNGKDDFLMVNMAVSDPQENKFYYDYKIEKMKSLLGFELPVDLSIEDKGNLWSLYGQEGKYLLKATMNDHNVGIDLKTEAVKPVLLHNGTGYERYGNYTEAGYVSYPRLQADGFITIEDEVIEVTGELWYDRQWNCIGVYTQDVAWDWFSVQFKESQEELMVYQLYNAADKSILYGGVYYNENNEQINVSNDLELTPVEFWTSPDSKIKYPVKWNIKVAKLDLDITATAILKEQELKIKFGPFTNLYYWEGMCNIEGTKEGQPVSGDSYIEMTNRNLRQE